MRPEAAGVGLPDRMNGMKSPECSDTMKITILGPAHPYRGGLASIMEIMARTFQRRGDEVDIKTFTLQYPSLLFPGESQTVATPPPADLRICRCVNTMNPLNWVRVGRRIRRERPDFVLMKYWTPFMAPCFGTIARIARGNGHTKVLCQIDNVEPHERHLTDKPFNRYYLHSVDGFVYMSEQVHSELRAYSDAPALFSPHPLFENFGERVERSEACVRLGLDPANRYVLFFGLIRDYKGLDLLLDAWAQLRRAGRTEGRRLIVAGEFYTAREPYLNRIADNGLQDEVLLHDRFIPDDDVKYYFSAARFRRTALQDRHAERRDADSLPVLRADGRHESRGTGRDRARRPGGVCLRTHARRGCRRHRTDVRRGHASTLPGKLRRGTPPLFVGGDVQPHHGAVRAGGFRKIGGAAASGRTVFSAFRLLFRRKDLSLRDLTHTLAYCGVTIHQSEIQVA